MRTLCKLPKKQKILFSVLHFDVQIVFYYMSGIHMHISTGHTMASGSPNQIKCGKEEELWKRNKWKWARKPSRPPLYWSKRTLWHPEDVNNLCSNSLYMEYKPTHKLRWEKQRSCSNLVLLRPYGGFIFDRIAACRHIRYPVLERICWGQCMVALPCCWDPWLHWSSVYATGKEISLP